MKNLLLYQCSVNEALDVWKKSHYKTIFNNPLFLEKVSVTVDWYLVKKVPDIIIFEGWCVGARAEKNITLKKSINSLERTADKNLRWRKYVNGQLQTKYKKLFSKLDCLLFLKAGNFKLLQSWRLKQEALLKLNSKNKANSKVMSKNEVLTFMQTYQRVTQNMFKFAPKYSSIVLNLNRNHQIKSIKYN